MPKKYFYMVMVALFATITLSLTSCGKDDNGSRSYLKGQVTLKVKGGTATTKYAYRAYWNSGHIHKTDPCDWETLKSGAEFSVYFSDTEISDGWDAYMIDTDHDGYLSLNVDGEIEEGAEISICSYHWDKYTNDFDNAGESRYSYDGEVIVKSVVDNIVTLQFNQFQFSYWERWAVGNSTSGSATMNGTISFKLDEDLG